MIRIAICDDENIHLNKAKKITENYCLKHKIPVFVETYPNGELLIYDVQENKHFDLVLLDIEMPGHNGMNIADYLKHYLPNTLIIFITSHLKYAIDSFELSIFRYIPKNELSPRLENALKDAIKIIDVESNESYTIQTATKFQKIMFKNILYIEKNGKNSVIRTFDNEVKVRKSLTDVYSELNPNEFAYIDRSCIVNILHILQIKNGEILLKNNETLLVSRSHIQELKTLLAILWSKNI